MLLDPSELLGAILTPNLCPHPQILRIGMNKGIGIDVDQISGHPSGDLLVTDKEAVRHIPTRVDLGIVELGLAVPPVVVVPKNHLPGNLQGGSGIDLLE